jgi:hypothetical protein
MRLKSKTVRRLFVALCAALALACAAPAPAQIKGREPRARKVGDYVNQFTSCNAGAYLDSFAIELQNDPAATGHVVVYGPGGTDDEFGQSMADAAKSYLVATRGIEDSRVRAVYAGRYEKMQELLTELWLVPDGAGPPPKTKYRPDFGFEGKFFERGLWDGPPVAVSDVGGWGSSSEVAMVGLSEMMRRRKDALAYLVAYHGEESTPGAWRRVTERQAEELREHGVEAGRLKVIFGGYAKEEKLQYWILPPDAPPPAKQRSERRPERSVQIASLDSFVLKYNVDWAFKGLADLLKADAQLTACLVVRPGPAEVEEADPGQTADPAEADPEEPPDVDVLQLAEKWKAEFKKNGIGEHRLIIMVMPTRELQSGGELETWVVPPGALLPDPSADDSFVAAEEEAENP